jgi:hypothetical protein
MSFFLSGDVLLFLKAEVVSLLFVFFLWVMGCNKCDVYVFGVVGGKVLTRVTTKNSRF